MLAKKNNWRSVDRLKCHNSVYSSWVGGLGIHSLFKMDNALIKRHGHVQKQQRRRVDFYYFIIFQCIVFDQGEKEREIGERERAN